MHLPRQTLSFPEALEILWHGREFFYLHDDKPQFTLRGEPEGYDPFRGVYLYGDEEGAAEDTAFVFFQVWGLPVDSLLYVTVPRSAASTYPDGDKGFPRPTDMDGLPPVGHPLPLSTALPSSASR